MWSRREIVRCSVRRHGVVAGIRRGRDCVEKVGHIVVRNGVCVGVVGGRAHDCDAVAVSRLRRMIGASLFGNED